MCVVLRRCCGSAARREEWHVRVRGVHLVGSRFWAASIRATSTSPGIPSRRWHGRHSGITRDQSRRLGASAQNRKTHRNLKYTVWPYPDVGVWYAMMGTKDERPQNCKSDGICGIQDTRQNAKSLLRDHPKCWWSISMAQRVRLPRYGGSDGMLFLCGVCGFSDFVGGGAIFGNGIYLQALHGWE